MSYQNKKPNSWICLHWYRLHALTYCKFKYILSFLFSSSFTAKFTLDRGLAPGLCIYLSPQNRAWVAHPTCAGSLQGNEFHSKKLVFLLSLDYKTIMLIMTKLCLIINFVRLERKMHLWLLVSLSSALFHLIGASPALFSRWHPSMFPLSLTRSLRLQHSCLPTGFPRDCRTMFL